MNTGMTCLPFGSAKSAITIAQAVKAENVQLVETRILVSTKLRVQISRN